MPRRPANKVRETRRGFGVITSPGGGGGGGGARGSRVTAPAPRTFGETKPSGSTQLNPGDNYSAIINGVGAAAVFWFAAGTHNMSAHALTVNYGHTFCGASGAIITCPTLPADAKLFTGAGAVSGITVRNLVIDGTGSTTVRQEGLLSFVNSINCVVQSCEIKYSAAFGVFLGNGGRISGCYIHHNGQGGSKAYAYSASNPLRGADNVIVEDSEICYNNTRKYQPFWEAGGFKMVAGQSAIVRRNHFHHNVGWGVWFDYTAGLHLIEDNLIEDESHGGITLEPAAKGSVDYRTGGNRTDAVLSECRYNTFRRVGRNADFNQIDSGLWGSGAVYVFASANYIHHNYGEGLCNGVGYLQQPRTHGGNNLGGTITFRSLTSNVATLTFGAAHGLVAGDPIHVQQVGSPFDTPLAGAGTFVASAPTTTTITYACTGANVANAAAGAGALCTWGDPRYFSVEGSIETDNEWILRTPVTTSALTNPAFTAAITSGSTQLDIAGDTDAERYINSHYGEAILQGTGMAGGAVTTRALTANVATLTFGAAHGLQAGDQVIVSGVGGAFDTGAYARTTVVSAPTTTTITYACVSANVASGAAPGGAKACPFILVFDVGNIQSYHSQAATPHRYVMSARATATNAAASITVGTKYNPARLGVSGLRVTEGVDRPPYEGIPGYSNYFDAVRFTISANIRSNLGANSTHPRASKNYYETDGYWQNFRWAAVFMEATDVGGATNPLSWTDYYPLDGPYS